MAESRVHPPEHRELWSPGWGEQRRLAPHQTSDRQGVCGGQSLTGPGQADPAPAPAYPEFVFSVLCRHCARDPGACWTVSFSQAGSLLIFVSSGPGLVPALQWALSTE